MCTRKYSYRKKIIKDRRNIYYDFTIVKKMIKYFKDRIPREKLIQKYQGQSDIYMYH